jgi:hypothetical protein
MLSRLTRARQLITGRNSTIFQQPITRYYSQDITKDDLKQIISAKESVVLIDVRTKPETESTDLPIIQTAKNVPRTVYA